MILDEVKVRGTSSFLADEQIHTFSGPSRFQPKEQNQWFSAMKVLDKTRCLI